MLRCEGPHPGLLGPAARPPNTGEGSRVTLVSHGPEPCHVSVPEARMCVRMALPGGIRVTPPCRRGTLRGKDVPRSHSKLSQT